MTSANQPPKNVREYGDLGGVICQQCHEEVFRIKDNICFRCLSKQAQVSEKEMEMRQMLKNVREEMVLKPRRLARKQQAQV